MFKQIFDQMSGQHAIDLRSLRSSDYVFDGFFAHFDDKNFVSVHMSKKLVTVKIVLFFCEPLH